MFNLDGPQVKFKYEACGIKNKVTWSYQRKILLTLRPQFSPIFPSLALEEPSPSIVVLRWEIEGHHGPLVTGSSYENNFLMVRFCNCLVSWASSTFPLTSQSQLMKVGRIVLCMKNYNGFPFVHLSTITWKKSPLNLQGQSQSIFCVQSKENLLILERLYFIF